MNQKFSVVGAFWVMGLGVIAWMFEKKPSSFNEASTSEQRSRHSDRFTDVSTSNASQGKANSSREKIVGESRSDVSPMSKEVKVSIYNRPQAGVLARIQGRRWVIQDDILINDSDVLSDTKDGDVAIATIREVKYWGDGVIPFVIESDEIRNTAIQAVLEFNEKTQVRFVERDTEPDYLVFRSSETDVCQSFLGRKGGEQEVIIHSSCSVGQVIHELMHTLGFVHEHSREDRDEFIAVYWDNILRPQLNQFQKIIARVSLPVYTEFDFKSVLLYPPTAFSRNGQPTLTKADGTTYPANRTRLSELDIVKVNGLYARDADKN